MSSSSSSSSSESEQSSSSSSSSDEAQATLKMRVIPDPSASWHPPGSLPTTSHSSSTSHGSVSAGPSSSQATQKKTRGPTYVHGPWGTSENGVLNVALNELNQVVKGYTSLASHLGVLARDGSLAPLTFTTWHYVPQQNKDNIWREIKKVRVEKAKNNNGIPASRPQVMTQMNELTEHVKGSCSDLVALNEQIFTQVRGPEQLGRVRTFGLGPSPTDVFGGRYRQSQEHNRIFQTQVQERVELQLQRHQMQLESKMNDVVDSLSSHPTIRPMPHQQQSHTFSSQERRTRTRRSRTNKERRLQAGYKRNIAEG
ncbi:unnamed protein product [Camellia sinensis]